MTQTCGGIPTARIQVSRLREEFAGGGAPAIICAQAGEVNTGAFDDLDDIADAAAGTAAWLHIDGAFGLWAAAAQRFAISSRAPAAPTRGPSTRTSG